MDEVCTREFACAGMSGYPRPATTTSIHQYLDVTPRRFYGRRWRTFSLLRLRANPLCVRCQAEGKVTAAEVTDHIRPHRGDEELFWDSLNHQSLCKRCHDRKTAIEDGGFGRSAGDGLGGFSA